MMEHQRKNQMLSRLSQRLKLRSNYGDLVMKPKAWDVLTSWNLLATSCKQELLKPKKLLIHFNKRLPMLKNPRAECNPTWKKFPWNTNVPTLAAIITEKRGRNFDKVVGEWKS